MRKSLQDWRREASMDAEYVDDLRYRLGVARMADPFDRNLVQDLERSLHQAENRASRSDFEAHRFDDERG